MTYKSITKAVGIAALAAFLCAGCGNKNSTGGDSKKEDPKPAYYVITFDANGGTVTPESDTTGKDGTLGALPAPKWEGYTFDAWYTAKTDGDVVTDSTVFKKDTAIYAQWTLVTYKIKFNGDGGSVTPDSGTTGDGWKLASLPTPTRTGYSFDGWFTAETGGDSVTVNKAYGKADTIYARWSPIVYVITFDANGGTVTPESDTTDVGGTLASLPEPTRTGYTFDGWFTEETDGEEVTENTVYDKDAAIYAQWTLITYKITFDANGGAVTPGSGTTGDGWKLASLPEPTRTGYTFNGWFTAETGGEEVTENTVYGKDATIYAQWTLNKYKVTFDPNGGAADPASGTTGDGWKLASLPTPTRAGYTFDGWFTEETDGEEVTGSTVYDKDATIYAQWTLNKYKVTFDPNGGAADPASGTTGDGWKLASLPTPTWNGYTFNGWYTSTTGGTKVETSTPFSGNTTVYAQWTWSSTTVYTITFDANGGEVTPESGTTGEGWRLASLPIPALGGHTFKGWFTAATGGTQVTAGTAFSANATVYAQWTINKYDVTFDSKDGDLVNSQSIEHGGKVTEPDDPARTNYAFGGWYKEDTYTAAWDFSTDVVTAAITLYAKWIPVYTVNFDLNGGSGDVSSQSIVSGGKVTEPATVPTRANYVFDGWYKEDTYITAWDFSTDVVTAAITLYAKWIPVYTVNFDLNGGSGDVSSQSIVSGGKVTEPATVPTRANYVFDGWYKEDTYTTEWNFSTDVVTSAITLYAKWTVFVTPPQPFTDGRDGKTYQKVTIGGQTWMAENLNYAASGSVCYDYCAKYGRLYDWSTAMNGSSSSSSNPSGVRGVCPVGWHLPSYAEWTALTDIVGGSLTAGTKLKSSQYWNSYSGVPVGTDDYGFAALPGGFGDGRGGFNIPGNKGHWWSTTQYSNGYAYYQSMDYDSERANRSNYNWATQMSVRCVEN